MTVARVISRSVANVIEQLELDGDLLVTANRLAAVMHHVGLDDDKTQARRLAYELQRDGWLGRLRTRHTWEFLPGARGGAYGSGDRYIEFRAQRAVDPTWSGVLAMESAASVLGLAQRLPTREVAALPPNAPFPKALAGDWRYVRVELLEAALTTVNGLPSWTLEGLIVGGHLVRHCQGIKGGRVTGFYTMLDDNLTVPFQTVVLDVDVTVAGVD